MGQAKTPGILLDKKEQEEEKEEEEVSLADAQSLLKRRSAELDQAQLELNASLEKSNLSQQRLNQRSTAC